MNHYWHWTYCPACNGEGWLDEITGASVGMNTSTVFKQRRRCECCEGSGRLRVPRGYSLKADVPSITVTLNLTNSTEEEAIA